MSDLLRLELFARGDCSKCKGIGLNHLRFAGAVLVENTGGTRETIMVLCSCVHVRMRETEPEGK